MLALLAAVGVEQLVDETRRLHLVEEAHAFAKALGGERFDVGFVEVVFIDNFQDQVALLIRAFPSRAGMSPRGDFLGHGLEALWVVVSSGCVHAVVGGWDEASGEDLLVHIGLEELVEALGFARDVVAGHQLGLDGDGELMGRVAGEAEALAVVCDEFDGHGGIGWGVSSSGV